MKRPPSCSKLMDVCAMARHRRCQTSLRCAPGRITVIIESKACAIYSTCIYLRNPSISSASPSVSSPKAISACNFLRVAKPCVLDHVHPRNVARPLPSQAQLLACHSLGLSLSALTLPDRDICAAGLTGLKHLFLYNHLTKTPLGDPEPVEAADDTLGTCHAWHGQKDSAANARSLRITVSHASIPSSRAI